LTSEYRGTKLKTTQYEQMHTCYPSVLYKTDKSKRNFNTISNLHFCILSESPLRYACKICVVVFKCRDVTCAALLEIRRQRQAERLAEENEKNAAVDETEPAAETDDITPSEAAAGEDGTAAVGIQQNDGDAGAETEADDEIETGESKSIVDVSADVSSSQTDVAAEEDMSGRLDQLEQTETPDSAHEAERRESDVSAAVQSASIEMSPVTDQELVSLSDVTLSEACDDDIDVIDMSNATAQSVSVTSNQHITACFEVCLLHLLLLLCFLKVGKNTCYG